MLWIRSYSFVSKTKNRIKYYFKVVYSPPRLCNNRFNLDQWFRLKHIPPSSRYARGSAEEYHIIRKKDFNGWTDVNSWRYNSYNSWKYLRNDTLSDDVSSWIKSINFFSRFRLSFVINLKEYSSNKSWCLKGGWLGTVRSKYFIWLHVSRRSWYFVFFAEPTMKKNDNHLIYFDSYSSFWLGKEAV